MLLIKLSEALFDNKIQPMSTSDIHTYFISNL